MKKYRLLILLPALLMASCWAMATDGKGVPAPLEGYVKDAVTRKPVAGVVVSLMTPDAKTAREAITNEEGYFQFVELPGNQVNLLFGKKGYLPYKKAGVVIRGKTTVMINVDFLRENAYTDPDSVNDNSEYPLLRMLEI